MGTSLYDGHKDKMKPFSEMTNEQLDRMIAEKRGYKYRKASSRSKDIKRWWSWTRILADGTFVYGAGHPPSFTTDPRYAMELLKEMVDTGGLIEIDKVGKDYRICFSDFLDVITEDFYRTIAIKWLQWRENVV